MRSRTRLTPPISYVLSDARWALKYVRLHAKQWNLNPERIATFGSSQAAVPAAFRRLHGGQGRRRVRRPRGPAVRSRGGRGLAPRPREHRSEAAAAVESRRPVGCAGLWMHFQRIDPTLRRIAADDGKMVAGELHNQRLPTDLHRKRMGADLARGHYGSELSHPFAAVGHRAEEVRRGPRRHVLSKVSRPRAHALQRHLGFLGPTTPVDGCSWSSRQTISPICSSIGSRTRLRYTTSAASLKWSRSKRNCAGAGGLDGPDSGRRSQEPATNVTQEQAGAKENRSRIRGRQRA